MVWVWWSRLCSDVIHDAWPMAIMDVGRERYDNDVEVYGLIYLSMLSYRYLVVGLVLSMSN